MGTPLDSIVAVQVGTASVTDELSVPIGGLLYGQQSIEGAVQRYEGFAYVPVSDTFCTAFLIS